MRLVRAAGRERGALVLKKATEAAESGFIVLFRRHAVCAKQRKILVTYLLLIKKKKLKIRKSKNIERKVVGLLLFHEFFKQHFVAGDGRDLYFLFDEGVGFWQMFFHVW